MKYCLVRFLPSDDKQYKSRKQYLYVTDMEDLIGGDVLVVPAKDNYALAEFVSYTDSPITELKEIEYKGYAVRPVVQKVDFSNYEALKAKEQKRQAIKERLEIEKKRIEELQVYDLLAKLNPSLKELVEEYKSLL